MSVAQNGSNGKVAVLVTSDLAQMALVLNLPDLSDDIHARVQRGDVRTGSAWDGVSLEKVYAARIAAGDSDPTAASVVDSVMLNRYYHARLQAGDGERDAAHAADELAEYARIEATLAAVEFDPPASLWEVV